MVHLKKKSSATKCTSPEIWARIFTIKEVCWISQGLDQQWLYTLLVGSWVRIVKNVLLDPKQILRRNIYRNISSSETAHQWARRVLVGHCGTGGGIWPGFEETSTDKGYNLWYNRKDTTHKHYMGFLIHVVKAVVSCTPISNRLFSICFSAKPQNITIIQEYNLSYTETTKWMSFTNS